MVDPTANEDVSNALAQKGIASFTLRTQEKDAVGIKKVFSSIAISYLDKPDDILPQVLPQSLPTLEYDICSRIFRLTQSGTPGLAIVAPYEPMDQRYNDPRMRQMMRQMGQQVPEKTDRFKNLTGTLQELGYQVSRVDLSSKENLPGNLKTLFVADPDNLSDRQKYEIAKALAEGKNVIIAAQQYKYNYNPVRGDVMIMPGKNETGINGLLSNYGVSLNDKILMDDQNQIVSIQTQGSLGGFIPVPINVDVQSPVQIKVTPDNMNDAFGFTQNLGPMVYLWGSALKIDSTKVNQLGLKFATLFTSSPKTWEVDYTGSPLATKTSDGQKMIGRQPLGIILTGQFPFPYENQPVPKWQDQSDSIPSPTETQSVTKEPGRLMLIGCSEIFTDQFIPDARFQGQKPAHEDLILKAVEGFTLSEDLLQIRSKSVEQRFLKETSPAAKILWRIFTILLAPAIIIAFGIVRMYMRQDRRQAYRRLLEQAGGGN